MKNYILNSNNIKKDAYIWNAIASMLNSFQMTLLLVFVTRFGNDRESSIFVMAYAIANLLLHVGKFGIRQFQVTDVQEKYCYKEYEILRKILVSTMLLGAMVYVAYKFLTGSYTGDKVILILLICAFRAIEAYEDVLHGRLQQVGRLDIAAKILSIRLILYIVLFVILYVLLKDVVLVSLISLVVQIVVAIYLNNIVTGVLQADKEWSWIKVKSLLKEVFPLGIAMFLNIYINNSPKYIIDELVSDTVQTQFNIIFMPVFVVAMLAGFIYQPLVKKMGMLWDSAEIETLNKQVLKISFATIGVALLATCAAFVAGIPALQLVYGVDLSQYRIELSILTFTGGIIALLNILIILLTTIRKQQFLLYGYVVIAVITLAFGDDVLKTFGVLGLCIMFMSVLLILLLYFTVIYLVEQKKNVIR